MTTGAESQHPHPPSGCSTGPKTPEGKARSSQNARTTGWFAQHLRLPDHQQAEFAAFEQSWREELDPQGLQELEAFSDFVRAAWHKREIVAAQNQTAASSPDAFLDEALAKTLDRLHRYERDFERRANRHLDSLRRLQAARNSELQKRTPAPPPESIPDEVLAELYTMNIHSQYCNALVRACRAGLIDKDTGRPLGLALAEAHQNRNFNPN